MSCFLHELGGGEPFGIGVNSVIVRGTSDVEFDCRFIAIVKCIGLWPVVAAGAGLFRSSAAPPHAHTANNVTKTAAAAANAVSGLRMNLRLCTTRSPLLKRKSRYEGSFRVSRSLSFLNAGR